MEYIFKEKLTFKQYDDFIKNQKYLSFMQEEMWAKVKNIKKHMIVGVLKNNKVCAVAHILVRKKKNKTYFFIPNGYLLDYSNKKLLSFFTEKIKVLAKIYNAYVVDVYPNINENSKEHIIAHENLINMGYKYSDYYFENTKSVMISLKNDNKKINKTELKEKYENKDFYLKRGIYFETSTNFQDINRLYKLENNKYLKKDLIERLISNYQDRIKIIFARLDLVYYTHYLKENTKNYDEISKVEELLTISDDIDIGCCLVIEPYNKKEPVCEIVYNAEKESFNDLDITNGLIYEVMKICSKKNYTNIKISNTNLNVVPLIERYDAIPYKYIGKYSLIIKKWTYFFNKEIHIKKR